ncbi:hypothetical protein GQ53DRAFT_827708 [Thozetella sp. PMI_491]|nr:hypothetical protein GQ53DRAFT_827708 [Thozetella sp. PMI_491]
MAEATNHPPESDAAQYLREVLCQPEGVMEADIDQLLFQKATALGIELPDYRTTADMSEVSGAGMSDTEGSQHHARSSSTVSDCTVASESPTSPTSPSLDGTSVLARKRSRSINFAPYDKYISEIDPNLNQPKFVYPPPPKPPDRAGSIFSVRSRKSITEFKRSIASKLRKRRPLPSTVDTITCVCCREDFFKDSTSLETLPCGHTYCRECLSVVIKQSMADESRMPPRCCTQPIPSNVIKTVLSREEQLSFLRAVAQYSTPWETRIFCPNSSCNEFIPPRTKIDPKYPCQVVCKHCKVRVCVMCKRRAHRLGQDCPEDWELEAVLKMGEKSGWRRCYKCRTLVELSQGCTHMTCRCKAQFCYICGGVWDPVVGCPNFCNGEEELERRRQEEEARLLELEAEEEAQKAAAAAEEVERREAERRTRNNDACAALQQQQADEMTRFRIFERKTRWIMWTGYAQKKMVVLERYTDQYAKMKDRHKKTEQHLEDRQIEAEMELTATLEQSEKSIRIQLKYMEAYCNGLGRFAGADMPTREVTQKHLEQLGQQYHLRDGMERRHQNQINVLREKQSKRMEELQARHKKELVGLSDKKENDIEDITLECNNEDEALVRVFEGRKANLVRRWEVASKILCKELEKLHGKRFAPVPLPVWPVVEEENPDEDGAMGLPAVQEEAILEDEEAL